MDTRWRIELLGRLRARYGGGEIARFPRPKAGELLAYLAYYPRRSHSREALIEVLWPEIDPELGRNALRKLLHWLRQQVELLGGDAEHLIVADRSSVSLRPEAFTTDVGEFTAALAAARAAPPGQPAARLAEAVARYGGELLPDSFESWVLTEREALRGQYLDALHQLVAALEAAGDLMGALQGARQAVAADPLREEAHYDLMRLYAATGQPAACLRQYQELERLLREELDETPSAEARALAEELRLQARTLVVARQPPAAHPGSWARIPGAPQRPDSPARAPGDREPRNGAPAPTPGAPLPESSVGTPGRLHVPADAEAVREEARPMGHGGTPPLSRLPLQFTRFFGREEEIARLTELLSSPVTRLVTVTGPGGSGKTRLAITVAGRMGGTGLGACPLEDALAYVGLTDLTDAARIPDAVAEALGLVRSREVEALEQLVEHLGARPWLLVLDNFEHLVEDGAMAVRTLLERVSTLTCLVTSRQRLGLAGEQEFALLPLPTPRRAVALEHIGAYASVQLFVDRARAVRANFRLTEANATAVGELCDRLEGLPLAIELAAARAAVLPPQQMLAELEQRFAFLVSRQRDLPPRHRTLRAVIESSYQLLSPELQQFFTRLAVFRGGWTLAAAREVCEEPLALDYLEQLRDCSLVLVEEEGGGAARFRLLETLREYAAEQLAASGELAEVQKRHRDWYLQLAADSEAAAVGPGLAEGPARLEAELDNFRVVLAWFRQEAEAHPNGEAAEAGLRMASALWSTWMQRGYIMEGLQWLEQALAHGSALPPSLRAPALFRAGYLARDRGDMDRWRTLRRASRGEYEKALALARQMGDQRAIARSLLSLADVTARDRDWDAAWSLCIEARPLFEALGEPRGLADTLEWLSRIAMSRGDRQAARPLLEERLVICRKLGESEPLIHALGAMGHLERDEGDYDRARALYRESLRLRRKFGHQIALAMSLEDFAVLAGRERQAERAIRLLGAAEAFCETLGARPPVADDTDYEHTVASGRAALGEAAFAAAWAEGRAMALEQAAEYALDETR